MKIHRLETSKVATAAKSKSITSLDENELKNVAGGCAAFSCVMLVQDPNGQPAMDYHCGYAR